MDCVRVKLQTYTHFYTVKRRPYLTLHGKMVIFNNENALALQLSRITLRTDVYGYNVPH